MIALFSEGLKYILDYNPSETLSTDIQSEITERILKRIRSYWESHLEKQRQKRMEGRSLDDEDGLDDSFLLIPLKEELQNDPDFKDKLSNNWILPT